MKIRARSFAKAISYRIWGSTTTLTITYFVTGSMPKALVVSSFEVVAKILIFWTHDSIWERYIQWGK